MWQDISQETKNLPYFWGHEIFQRFASYSFKIHFIRLENFGFLNRILYRLQSKLPFRAKLPIHGIPMVFITLLTLWWPTLIKFWCTIAMLGIGLSCDRPDFLFTHQVISYFFRCSLIYRYFIYIFLIIIMVIKPIILRQTCFKCHNFEDRILKYILSKRINLWSIADHIHTEEENISDILFAFSASC